MKALGIVPNWKKLNNAKIMVERIADFCRAHGVQAYLAASEELEPLAGLPVIAAADFPGRVDLVLVLGGDGTMLRAASVSGTNLPLLGLNLGRWVLAEVEPPLLEEALQLLLQGITINHRIMLWARVFRDDRQLVEYTALNDVVISKGLASRIIYLDTYVNDKHLKHIPVTVLLSLHLPVPQVIRCQQAAP